MENRTFTFGKIVLHPMHGDVVACFCLVSPHDSQQQEKQAKMVPDGHGRSYGSGPWQKGVGCSLVSTLKSYTIYIILQVWVTL